MNLNHLFDLHLSSQNKSEIVTLNYSLFKTKFGLCIVASTEYGICNVMFFDKHEEALDDLQKRWPNAKLINISLPEHVFIKNYLSGTASKTKIKLHLSGTDFQCKVWNALLTIPTDSLSTYGKIAQELGDPKLSRAVGTAIGSNPIGYLIPCHRVVKSNGELSGYRWGVHRKKMMLDFEASKK